MSGYLTVAAVADEFGVSARTVLRWIERGEMAAVRLPGGRLRVSIVEVASRSQEWSTISTDNAGGPAQRELPGPGTEVEAPCK